jgi:cytochrome c551/c552
MRVGVKMVRRIKDRMKGLVFFLGFASLSAGAGHDADVRFFDERVAPILSKRCLACHNEELKNGGISFLDRKSLLKGGSRGPAVVPGKPGASILVIALKHEGELQMPPGPKLPKKEIEVLTAWVARGAVWGTKLRAQVKRD